MELLKGDSKVKNFWVVDYTKEDKDFFIGIGFTCDEFRETLTFRGSKSFGWWNDEEYSKISSAVRKKYGKCKPRKLTLADRM